MTTDKTTDAARICDALAQRYNWARVEYTNSGYVRNLSPAGEFGWEPVTPEQLAAVTPPPTDAARECADEINKYFEGVTGSLLGRQFLDQFIAIIRRHMTPATPPAAPESISGEFGRGHALLWSQSGERPGMATMTESGEVELTQAPNDPADPIWPCVATLHDVNGIHSLYGTRITEIDAEVIGDSILAAFAERDALRAENARLREALEGIARGEGRFNRAPHIHAENCIEDMKATARAALGETK